MRTLIEADDELLAGDQTEVIVTPAETAVRWGLVLPYVMLKRALSPYLSTLLKRSSVCVAVCVPASDWTDPLTSAVKLFGIFETFLDNSVKPSQRDQAFRDFALRLASGKKSLFVMSGVADAFSSKACSMADIVLTIDRIELQDLHAAILLSTGRRGRGLAPEDALGLELLPAMGAIRVGTSASACVTRLRALRNPRPDNLVAAAPLLENLHGYGEARDWGLRLVKELDAWRAGELSMADIQRNAVLAGPPGVGKSTYARSLAKSTKLPLVVTSLGALFSSTDGYLGGIIKGIDAAFAEARAAGPAAILLIDELDAVGSRDRLNGSHDQWWINVVNHLLTTLDSVLSRATNNLVVLATTNHIDRVDPAILRPGRLDRVIWIEPPEVEDIAAILRQHLGAELPDADLRPLANLLAGATGAELSGLIKSARSAARAAGHSLTIHDLLAEACPPSTADKEDLWRICVHEAGHIVAALRLRSAAVRSVSIGTRAKASGISGGHVVLESRVNQLSGAEVHQAAVVQLLSGRAAELVILGSVSGGAGGGAQSDLARASAMLAKKHLSLGLGDSLFSAADPIDALERARRSPLLVAKMEVELQVLHAEAVTIITGDQDAVLALAKRLEKDRILDSVEILQVLNLAGFVNE